MKPCSGVSAFADRNYGPDNKAGMDEEGDVSASYDEDLLLRCRHSGPTRSGGIGIPVVFKELG
jgi:hypothetical protein